MDLMNLLLLNESVDADCQDNLDGRSALHNLLMSKIFAEGVARGCQDSIGILRSFAKRCDINSRSWKTGVLLVS